MSFDMFYCTYFTDRNAAQEYIEWTVALKINRVIHFNNYLAEMNRLTFLPFKK